MKLLPIALMHKLTALKVVLLKFGVWGVGAVALLDSALIPVTPYPAIAAYVHAYPHRFLLCCVVSAAASALGTLVPFYFGRAGGELFLLKRINRERYERIRDKFERQEFFAIMVPAMCPPPFPLKVFEIAAGVFEMKPLLFFAAIFSGKMVQFVIFSVMIIWFEPWLHVLHHMMHDHMGLMIGIGVVVLLVLAFFVVRRVFDRRRGEKLPAEEAEAS